MIRSGVRLVARGGRADEDHVHPIRSGPWPQPGDIVEIFSNSQQAWFKGKIDSREDNMVTVSYEQLGLMATKTLPADHANLRAFKAEKGKGKGREKGSSNGERGSVIEEKGSAMPKGGYSSAAEEEERPLQVPVLEGDPVEIYSNSMQCWCKGYVESIRGNLVTMSYQSPSADGCGFDWTKKTLPSEHNQWRKAVNATGHGMTRAADSTEDYDIGDAVEIYSNSNEVWCKGRVTQKRRGVVTVCFQLPGAGPDDWLEKDIKAPSSSIRPGREEALETGGSSSGSSMYTEMEKACYEREFLEVSEGQTVASVREVADHLARSQLPRKALKEVWVVGNYAGKDPVSRTEFFLCCRLVGHCQCFAEDRAGPNLLQEGGEPLRTKLHNEFKQNPPRRLPDFYPASR